MPLLSIQNLSKSFGGLTALEDINIDIKEGQIIGLVGPNGAGKTTLINLITGFEGVTKGKIYYDDLDITNMPVYKRSLLGITRTFQVPQHFKSLTVYENILIPLLLRNSEAVAVDKVITIAKKMFLSEDLDKDADSLPIGKLKLLEIAKAYATSPKLLLVDEPVGGLSADKMDAVIETIQELRNEGITILLVEHVMKAVMSLVDEVVVLNFGKILAKGLPQDIMSQQAVIEAYLGEDYA
ncbi:MAG: ABC transporter ATP-binding protein [Thermodesulfovibrionales bacterium]|nr:ABC transporter ATP-binding protein [Thermodesulfovibrionales bacterium]